MYSSHSGYSFIHIHTYPCTHVHMCMRAHAKRSIENLHHQTGWSRGSLLDCYSGGSQFKYLLGFLLSWMRCLWLSSVLPIKCWYNTSIWPWPLPSKSIPIYNHSSVILLWCYTISVQKTLLNYNVQKRRLHCLIRLLIYVRFNVYPRFKRIFVLLYIF
jgi:hypothetical protein